MSNQYETVFILTPVLSNEQMNEAVDKFRKILTDNGAMIVHENNWGLRKLAYPIQKKNTGFYYLIEFKSSGELIFLTLIPLIVSSLKFCFKSGILKSTGLCSASDVVVLAFDFLELEILK